MSLTLISSIVDKLALICAFSIFAQILEASGLFARLAATSRLFITPQRQAAFWFIVAFCLSGIFNDMTIAALLMPIVLASAQAISFPRPDLLLLVTAFGISTGGDLTVFGGNDNLIALGLLQNTPYAFSKLAWSRLFGPCTLLIGFCALLVCIFSVRKISWEPSKVQAANKEVKWLLVVSVACMIILAFMSSSYFVLLLAIIGAMVAGIVQQLFTKLPYKAMLIWTIAFIVGKLLAQYVAPQLNIPTNVYLLIAVLILATNVITNTALMSAALPFILASGLPAAYCYAAIKAINAAYLTIYGNSCLAVAAGYSLKQRDLFKYGTPIVLFTYIAIILCF